MPQIAGNVTISGPGASELAVSGHGQSRVFDIAAGAVASISGLTIEDGSVGTFGRGGAVNNAGDLTLTDSTITGSGNVVAPAADLGGGIYNRGYLHLIDTSVTHDAAVRGGGIYNSAAGYAKLTGSTVADDADPNLGSPQGGGIDNAGSMVITDSTIADNTATGPGGGIFNSGILTIHDSTISGNSTTEQRRRHL